MGKINDARKAMLKTQLEHAVVEHVGTEANDYPSYDVGTYSVFVPGAVREHNIVKAESEKEAREKVGTYLENKIDGMSESETNDVTLQPQNMKIPMKATEKGNK